MTPHTPATAHATVPAVLEMRATAHPSHKAARTANGWGVVDNKGNWLIPDQFAAIGDVRHVTINYEKLCITLSNETRWVAAVQQADGMWGAVKLEMRAGEEVTLFVFSTQETAFACVSEA